MKADTKNTNPPPSPDNTKEETPEARRARLSRPVGAADFVIVRQKCPDIPPEMVAKFLFSGR